MKQRLEKIARVVAVQKQMHRLAEWRLIALQRQEEDLRDQARHLIRSMNDDVPLRGLIVNSMVRRLTSLGVETETVEAAREAQTDVVLAEGRKLKQAEHMEDRVAMAQERRDNRRQLDDAIGDSLARRPAAPDGY
jgi:hypothetical protein